MDLAKYRDFEIQSPTRFTIDPSEYSFQWQGDGWQVSQNYLALAFPGNFPDAPLTNGHLHTLVFGYANKLAVNSSRKTNILHWSLLPTMAVSSNQIRNPETTGQESFRLDGHLIWEHAMHHNGSLFGGLCLGALNGEYKAIPAIGINYRDPKWEFTLAYPQSQFLYAIKPTIRFHSQWLLSGNQWSVLDHDLGMRSDFNFTSRRIKLGVTTEVLNVGYIEVSWFYLYNQTMSYLARNNARISADADNTSGWLIHYSYEFRNPG